jgi:predicted PhzF superfamily epimerase YddE/YHI9
MHAAVYQVVTFSTELFGGNPAFVVSLAREAADATMQALTAQLNELVLASLRISPGQPTTVRFHTREGRHSGAGHAMMAAAHVAFEGLGAGGIETTLALSDGLLRTVSREGTRIAVPWPVMPATPVERRDVLGVALGSRPKETLDAAFGYVAVYDRQSQIAALQPDMQALSKLDRGAVIATAPGEQSDFVLRVFAPKLGLPEDPVCGTAHRILVPYWAERSGRDRLHSRQLSPRGGELWCWQEQDYVVISGESRTFLKGSIEMPDS